MQHPFFSPLGERELALLLVTLTVGGTEQTSIFAGLDGEAAARLDDRAQALGAIAADKRVPLMVRELKRALEHNGRRGIERVDPSWIVHHLRGEPPRVVATLLLSLPPPLVRSVLRRLPPALRAALPAKEEIRSIRPRIGHDLRTLFERRFVAMPEPHAGELSFVDMIHLDRAELFHLVRDLGLTELGQAFVAVGRMALLELCRRLPRQHAEELVHAVKVASRVDLPDPQAARRFLSRVVVNFENTEEFLQKAGLWRLAKATLGEPAGFRPVLAQRLPMRAAQFLLGFLDKAQEMGDITGEMQARLQDSLLVRIVQLSREGRLSDHWQKRSMRYHDPRAAADALSSGDDGPTTAEPSPLGGDDYAMMPGAGGASAAEPDADMAAPPGEED